MKFWICSLLLLGYSYAYAQSSTSDSLYVALQQDTLRDQFIAYLEVEDYDNAITTIRKLYALAPTSLNSIQARVDEGVVFYQTGNPEVSLDIFRKVIADYDESIFDWQREQLIGRAYKYMSVAYSEQERHDEQLDHAYDFVSAADRMQFGFNSIDARVALAEAYYDLENIDSAIIVIADALRLAAQRDLHHNITDDFSAISGGDSIFSLERWRSRVVLYNLRGSIEERRYEYAAAADYYRQAVEAYEVIIRSTSDLDSRVSVMSPMINLAYNHYLSGDYYAAEREAKRVHQMLLALPKYQYYWIEDEVYYLLGMMAEARHDYDEAEAYLLQCLAIRESIDAKSIRYADVVAALGDITLSQKEYKKSISYLEIVDKIPDYSPSLRAIHKQRLANAYAYIGEYGIADKHVQEVADILRDATLSRGLPQLYKTRAHIAAHRGDTTAAISYLQRALTLTDEPITTSVTIEIATQLVKLHIGKPDFEQYYRRALDYTRGHAGEVGAIFEDYLILIYDAEGKHSRRIGDLDRAYTAMIRQRDLLQELRTIPRSESSKLTLAEESRRLHDDLLSVCFALYQQQPEQVYIAEAFKTIEQSKATMLLETLQDMESRRAVGVPDSLIRYERDLRVALVRLRREYEKLRTDEEASQLQTEQALMRIKDRKSEHTALLERIERTYPRYYQLRHSLAVDRIENAIAHLAPDERFVSYYTDDAVLYTITVATDGSTFYKQTLAQPLSQQVQQLRQHIDRKGDLASSRALYDVVTQGVETTDDRTWIILPDGALHYLPFELLLSGESATDYLLADRPILYNYSATVYGRSQREERTTDRYGYVGYAPGDNRYSNLPKLAHTEREVQQAASIFASEKMYVASEATRPRVLSTLPGHAIAHFATHTRVLPEAPERSRLLLADTPQDSGYLYLADLYNLSLDADLVVLSACNTGTGQYLEGEGVMSLARGFSYAGCPNVVMTNWAVEDRSTSEVMTAFYRNIEQGMGKARAMQQAKLAYLEDASRNVAHPYYWGGIMVVGNTAAMEVSGSYTWQWLTSLVVLSVVLIGGYVVYRRRAYTKGASSQGSH